MLTVAFLCVGWLAFINTVVAARWGKAMLEQRFSEAVALNKQLAKTQKARSLWNSIENKQLLFLEVIVIDALAIALALKISTYSIMLSVLAFIGTHLISILLIRLVKKIRAG